MNSRSKSRSTIIVDEALGDGQRRYVADQNGPNGFTESVTAANS